MKLTPNNMNIYGFPSKLHIPTHESVARINSSVYLNNNNFLDVVAGRNSLSNALAGKILIGVTEFIWE
jgi:hypothetical protein